MHAEPTAPFESLYRTRDGGVTWRLVRGRLPTVGPVAFRSKREGWLGGLRLYRTKDGGRSWLRVRLRIPRGRGDEDFGAASFHGSSGLLAAAFLRGGAFLVWVYSTDDGGRRWVVRARFRGRAGPEWPGIRVSSPQQGVVWITAATLRPMLYVTADAGRHWSRRPLRFRAVGKLVALDTSGAIVQTLDGKAFVTHDRGANWRRVALPT
jgi:photosystem II stability/assembly factor-like uncharacterized protein